MATHGYPSSGYAQPPPPTNPNHTYPPQMYASPQHVSPHQANVYPHAAPYHPGAYHPHPSVSDDQGGAGLMGVNEHMRPAQGMPVMPPNQYGNRIKHFLMGQGPQYHHQPHQVVHQAVGSAMPVAVGSPPGVIQAVQPMVVQEQRPQMWQWRVGILVIFLLYRGIDFFVHQERYISKDTDDDSSTGFLNFFRSLWFLLCAGCTMAAVFLSYQFPWVALLELLAIVVLFATQQFYLIYLAVLFLFTTYAMQLTHIVCTRWIECQWRFYPFFKPQPWTIVVDSLLGPIVAIWAGSLISNGRLGSLWGDWDKLHPALIGYTIPLFLGTLGVVCVAHAVIGNFFFGAGRRHGMQRQEDEEL